ncbi:hypothetical protein DPMN_017420 [Dreissena polymorpha]|uniref:Uncharacterized protein n=1 Tax=Dreissena polymorpha TaxID=45954 RepID=A0A9D4NGG3_DREPO|nr:hypothetical protein DPMN_017420 [Dreissena polymorpha]
MPPTALKRKQGPLFTLTSRRRPIGMNLFRPGLLIRCTLTSLSAGTFNYDRTYYATFCLAPFGRTRCTLTSRPLADKQEFSHGSELVHAELTLAAYRDKLVAARGFN